MGTFEAGAFDVDIRQQAIEPARQPPGLLTKEVHERWHQHHPHHKGIEEHADGEAKANGAHHAELREHEAAEHRGHDDRGRGDNRTAVAHTRDHRAARAQAVNVGLTHAGRDEQLVVHCEAEENAGQQDRQERQERCRVVNIEEAARPSPLIHSSHHTERGKERQHEAQRCECGHHE